VGDVAGVLAFITQGRRLKSDPRNQLRSDCLERQAARAKPSNATSNALASWSNPVGATKLFSLMFYRSGLRNFEKFLKPGAPILTQPLSRSKAFPS